MNVTVTLATLSLLTLTACAHNPGSTAQSGGAGLETSPVLVNVTNNYVLQVDVTAIGCGTSYRMGTVSAGIVSHFVLRQSMLACGGRVEFVAQPAGTEPLVRAGEELLKPGDVVDFIITTHLVASYTWVRS